MVCRRVTLALGLLVVGAAAGCGDDAPPVTVPMSAPPPPEPTERGLGSSPGASAEPTAGPTGSYRLGTLPAGTAAAGTGSARAAGRSIHACCDALDKAAKSSTTEANRKLYEQSTRVCYQKANQILQGAVTVEQALAQVRSSLLGAAPSQCY